MQALTSDEINILKEFNRNVAWLKQKDLKGKSSLWVSVTEVVKRTGWNKEGMRRAREQGLVKWKKENGSFFYDLTSIHEMFLINK